MRGHSAEFRAPFSTAVELRIVAEVSASGISLHCSYLGVLKTSGVGFGVVMAAAAAEEEEQEQARQEQARSKQRQEQAQEEGERRRRRARWCRFSRGCIWM